ncbi:MAG: ATP-binding protein [Xanthomonadales bacterium]|nr:ATP-binding protein [Xanthomonadales bacterium]
MKIPSLFSKADDSFDDTERLLAAQVRFMYQTSLHETIASTVIALIVGAYFWFFHGSTAALAWIVYFVLVGIARGVVFMTYRRADDVDSNPGSWITAATLTLLGSGLGWGASAFLFFDLSPLLTGVVVVGMGISGLLLLAPSPRVMAAFNIPLFAGLMFELLMAGDPAYLFAAGVVVLLAATMVFHAVQMQAEMRASLKLAYEKERLVNVLSGSKKELEALNQKLSEEVAQRRRVEEEVKAAKIAAEAANMAKDEFLATMSHEIRTPLNGILPILDILRGTKLNETQRDYLSTAFQSSKHLLTIIDDILDYSKIEAGKLDLETVGMNLRELLDSVVRLMSSGAEKKGLELKAVIEPGVRLAMRGDPVRLRQVLTNLVSNAIKFTEKGSVTITISKRQELPKETELLFTVRDTGVGMDKKTSERLFKPFSQADASTTRTYGGTGLGLVICKRLVELMNGKIGVKSQPGKGSVFWFTARLKKSIGDIQASAKELSNSKALIVSTDTELRRRLGVFADRWSLKANAVPSIKDASNRLSNTAELGASWRFDVLIIDLGKEAEESIALLKQLREDDRLSSMVVLLLTEDGKLPAEVESLQGVDARERSANEGSIQSALDTLLAGGGRSDDDSVSERELSYATDTLAGETLEGKVLLVEDNPVNLHVAQKLLGVIGLEFEVAKNGKEAIDMLRKDHERFDAILMDCMMPVMDGYTATREWRKLEERGGLGHKPILAMTANAMAGDREKCLNAGMDDYMSKPLNKALLRETIGRALAKQGKGPKQGDVVSKKKADTGPEKVAAEKASIIIDQQTLSDVMEIMGDDFQDLVSVYLEDSPKTLKQLAKAAESGKDADLIPPAHALKSTSANLGAIGLSELAKSLEHDARSGKVEHVPQRVREMIKLYKQVAVRLNKLRRKKTA